MDRRICAVAIVLVCSLLGTRAAEAQPGPQLRPTLRDVMTNYRAVLQEQPRPAVVLVTMGIGSLPWERHGHIALCVHYDDSQDDTCYNYGIGDFQQPFKMAWGFFRGTNSFWVGPQRPDELLWVYHHADRTIWIQPIPLTAEQKMHVINKLESDILPENRYYSYDHFWDNCTTRVRDVLDNATNGALSSMKEPTDGRTFRDLARDGFYGLSVAGDEHGRVPLLVTDIAMGRVTDRVPTYWERMFLPDYLREAAHRRWNVEPAVIYQRQGPPPLREGPSGRGWFVLLVLLLTAPVWVTRLLGRFQRTGLAVTVVPLVLFGLVFWGLALISPLPYVRWNETCLILMPLDVLLLVLPQHKRRLYARGRVVMLGIVAALLLVNVLKAPLWPILLWALVPSAVVGWWPARWTRAARAPLAAVASEPVGKGPRGKQRKRA